MKQENVKKIINFINNTPDFKIQDSYDGEYNHMGATIVDAVLQAGLNYKTVVKPRVNDIKKYPEAATVKGFINFIEQNGIKTVLRWNDDKKPKIIENVALFFYRNNIDTEEDLKKWLSHDKNIIELKKIKGIGDKTVDYIKILVGHKTVAVDRHVFNFLLKAGIEINNYEDAKNTMNNAADSMNIDRAIFDHSVWKYMSEK